MIPYSVPCTSYLPSPRMVVAAMSELVGGSSILNAPRQRRTTLNQVDPNFDTIRKFPTLQLPLCR